jgi:hypothetical protein
MLEKLYTIFEKEGFIPVIKENDFIFFKRGDGGKFEYYMIEEVLKLGNVLENQVKNFKKIKQKLDDRELEKNTTYLICFKNEKLPLSSIDYKQVLEIEEDSYYFRKLVLPYTQNQLTKISGINDFSNIIKDIDTFEEFKKDCMENNLSESLYEIVSQLYIKLPFFKLPTISERKNIILEEYRHSLKDEELKILNFVENINIDDIWDNEEFYKQIEEIV